MCPIVNYIFCKNSQKITARAMKFTIFHENNKEKALSSLKKSQSKKWTLSHFVKKYTLYYIMS